MDLSQKTRKEVGALGERVVAYYLTRHGMQIIDRNVARKTGEIDVIAREEDTLHFVEVKSILCQDFPQSDSLDDDYDPSVNLHESKIRKVARTAEWYVAESKWEGEWQVDGCLVWLRVHDGHARVVYLPQIV
jgi:putative endonuclease